MAYERYRDADDAISGDVACLRVDVSPACGRTNGVAYHAGEDAGRRWPHQCECFARASGPFVAAVWAASLPAGTTDIYAAVSRDGGSTFGAAGSRQRDAG